ncbi:MAG TPA: Mur ligase family protein [Candidatus Saccharimonadales bacterium]|nr:Mur ligase family protein [Candidatus Saccharimonadales bacterium]
MKKLAKKAVAAILGYQVRALYKKNKFQVVAVAGSVGKTSTKLAIAKVLEANYRVQYQDGNYNDIVSVPLIFFGEKMPGLMNPLAWAAIFWRNQRKLSKPYPYDIVVVEAGTDMPGQINGFKSYLRVDLGVLTAIAAEHMEFFADLDAVAKEELGIAEFSTNLVYNKDLCDEKYLSGLAVSKLSYGINSKSDFQAANIVFKDEKCDFEVYRNGKRFLNTTNDLLAEPQLYSVIAAVAVAAQLGMDAAEIDKGLHNINPVSGRMSRLKGIKGSVILDDTYNASPEAMKAALKTLYRLKSPQKIAILGNMNELGNYSRNAHKEIGQICDPAQLNLVVTIGPDANNFLAPAAKARGCETATFNSPYDAGNFVKAKIEKGAVILAKGSQNKVFAEEAVKILLANKADSSKLVRQSADWLKIKQAAFGK